MRELPVVFENEDCIVLNKPAGLAVQGGAGIGVSLDTILAERWTPRPLLVHRLDRDTSGLLLVARSREGAAYFSRLFARSSAPAGEGLGGAQASPGITKEYLAVCAGRPQPAEGRVTESLLALRGESRGGPPRRSETRYRLFREGEGFSLLEILLLTGRMHQIRRHLAQRGNPVLGDDKYGDFTLNRRLRRELGFKRLLLHASHLVIPGLPDLRAPLPEYFSPFLDRMGLSGPGLNKLLYHI